MLLYLWDDPKRFTDKLTCGRGPEGGEGRGQILLRSGVSVALKEKVLACRRESRAPGVWRREKGAADAHTPGLMAPSCDFRLLDRVNGKRVWGRGLPCTDTF